MRKAYELLGLAPGVTPADIKRAFRRLAMHWHPDRNPAPAAAEHFRALRQAHDRLLTACASPDAGTTAETMQEDGHADGPASAHDGPPPPGDDAGPRGADRFMELDLSFEEAFRGGSKQICLHQPAACTHCTGTGETRLAVTRLCEPCRGSGRIRSNKGLQRCTACEGRGYRNTEPCRACEGSGRQTQERWLAVSLPAGLSNGDSLRLAGEGEPHPEYADRPGDLHLRIRLIPHPLYTRSGRDLLMQRPISALRLLIGGTVRIPHPGGCRDLTLDAGSASSRRVILEGEGFPARPGRAAGKLVIDFVPLMMTQADDGLRVHLEALEAELQRRLSHCLPELDAWEAQWLRDVQ
ncbi:DnaJ C-terminal domain-containing protein [Thauera linaloolentis]|uniref:Heat shock protein DnaJ n=1 Tax=Thauera linaloolentis (strain DSM 12138 / JCM 21573 / CCUG 41526 / CIP 105981 / IAM 15112 / NBRC 102519 / 47Lol) TaxID=1123367 RepID=N6Z6V0_THAL4|nr:DnaJ C-terminal domain-containing protein [Thauera linaloolentis]ENO90098.1 heat shock protein DnaJ [Thauera linaloolentis 47Lol = DSM 12138]MCM8565382.1 DnaJ domain-containing protein [Thauera linaloolentis]